MKTIIGIDPGERVSGMVALRGSDIIEALNIPNEAVFDKIMAYTGKHYSVRDEIVVLIEDIQPYLGRLSQNVIETAKFIGELKYRLSCTIGCLLIKRSEIKQYVFNNFTDLVAPKIQKRIEKKGYKLKNGEYRTPHFMYVNDLLVQVAMRNYWKIEKPYKHNKYGLSEHSWQALALVTCYISQQIYEK